MSATAWFIIAIVGFSLAGIAFVAAVLMFIKMNIPAIIGDLSGKTVAREIKAMRDANAASGDKRFRPSKVNLERGTLTDKVEQAHLDVTAQKKAHASKRLDRTTGELGQTAAKRKSGTIGLAEATYEADDIGASPTESLSTETEVLSDNATVVLSDNATEVLSDNATEVLSDNATEVLTEGTTILSGGTTVLDPTDKLEEPEQIDKPVSFVIVKSLIEIHTDEVIE